MGVGFSAPVQTGPRTHPASYTMGTESFPGVKSSRGVTLTPHPLLVPWSWKSRAIPLLPLWAVWPVQSLSACTRVHFIFTLFILVWLHTLLDTLGAWAVQSGMKINPGKSKALRFTRANVKNPLGTLVVTQKFWKRAVVHTWEQSYKTI